MAVHAPVRGHTPDDVITATALVKTYRQGTAEVRALDGVSVGIQRARFTAVVGPSGSGTSTLMHCVAGLDTVTSGSIVLDGTEITGLSDRQLTRVRRAAVGRTDGGVLHLRAPQWYCSRSTRQASPPSNSKVRHHGPLMWIV